MKKLVLSLLTIILVSSSCSDFLDRNSLSELSNETYWSSKEDADMALVGCYDALQSYYLHRPNPGFGNPFNLEYITDNGYFPADYTYMDGSLIASGKHSPNDYFFMGLWKEVYTGINRSNEVINYVPPMIEKGILTKDEGDRYVAEAKFIRALMYNYLTVLYRDVPLFLEPQTTSNNQVPKSKRADIVKIITDDLIEIADILPRSKELTEAEGGRVTKGAALALLTRIYLYNGMYQEAADAADAVIKLNDYAIYPSYATLFTATGEKSNEIIFAVKYSGEGTDEGGSLTMNWNAPVYWMLPHTNLEKEYYCKDGLPPSKSPLYNEYDDSTRDPRLVVNLITLNSYWEGVQCRDAWWMWYYNPSGNFMRKFQREYYYEGMYYRDDQDYYILRYADVLLMRAEALAKLSTGKQEIMDRIDEVRQRADVMMPKVKDVEGTNLSYDELLGLVKHERRIETAFEGLRYFDLLRWKDLERAYAVTASEGVGASRSVDPQKSYVWPIPQDELDRNKLLKQHPEWGGE